MSIKPALFLSLLLSLPLAAAEKKALVGGTLINGLGSTPIRDSVILINDGTIEKVGTVDSLVVPEGYQLISTEAMSVMPGLWDMHVHLMINGHSDYGHWHSAYLDRFAGEIMPASAVQLLLAGITSARDLGAPLDASLEVRDRINQGEIPGPRMFMSGPFIQHKPYPGTEAYRWGVDSPRDAREKVNRLADAGVDIIKMVDQDEMTFEESEAVVDQAHKRGLKVVGHSHRPEEIRRGLAIGVDNFEHTGLAAAPEYPEDVMIPHRNRPRTRRTAVLDADCRGPVELRLHAGQSGSPGYRLLAPRPGSRHHRRHQPIHCPPRRTALLPTHAQAQTHPAAENPATARSRRCDADRHRQRHSDEIPLPVHLA